MVPEILIKFHIANSQRHLLQNYITAFFSTWVFFNTHFQKTGKEGRIHLYFALSLPSAQELLDIYLKIYF